MWLSAEEALDLRGLGEGLSDLSDYEVSDGEDFGGDESYWQFLAHSASGSGIDPDESLPRSPGATTDAASTTGAQHAKLASGVAATYPWVDEAAFAADVARGVPEATLQAAHCLEARHQVSYLKRKLGLQGVAVAARQRRLPSLDDLNEAWEHACEQGARRSFVERIASQYDARPRTLRRHFLRIGFDPCPASVEEVIAALREIQSEIWCRHLGLTFAEVCVGLAAVSPLQLRSSSYDAVPAPVPNPSRQARLRSLGVYARPSVIRLALRCMDPDGTRLRAKETQATRYRYCVPGPRSLYHADGHEKLAKLWGIWLHLMVDGYSRKILSLKAEPNKLAETVERHFVAACDTWGWASRVRWDKGKENVLAALRQLEKRGPGRGSVLTGRSVQNMRAEYVWVFVRRHVSGPFRLHFFGMMRAGILDISNPFDMHALHVTFLPIVQRACNDFVQMWNSHRIRGQPTVMGYGGGTPDRLWCDDVASETVMLDDAGFSAQGEAVYGVDEPHAGEASELSFAERLTLDPLQPWPQLQRFRDRFVVEWGMADFDVSSAGLDSGSDRGLVEYQVYRYSSMELQIGALTFPGLSLIDWDSFCNAESAYEYSARHSLRQKLASLAADM